jgi:hypothetical protein
MAQILLEQSIGGHLVIPVLEELAGSWRLTIIIQMGTSGEVHVDPIPAESILADLLDVDGNTFEQFTRPPDGALPIRGSRSLQSTAVFTFATAAVAPTSVRIRIAAGSATFAADQQRPTLPAFTTVPPLGGRFPVPPPPESALDRLLRALGDLLRALGLLIQNLLNRRHCCVNRFQAPATTTPGTKSKAFTVAARFDTDVRTFCLCECCEYRQFVRGTFRDAAGDSIPFLLPDGPFDPVAFREDCVINQFGPGKHGCFGHHDTSTAGDTYSSPDNAVGCNYDGRNTTRCGATEVLHAEYIGLIIDRCRQKVVASRAWTVNL